MKKFWAIATMLAVLGLAGVCQDKGRPAEGQKAAGQAQSQAAQAAPAAAANPEDVKSIDAIVKAVYACISGPAGHKRDWNRFRSLYLPGARLVPTGRRANGEMGPRVFTVDEYVRNADPYFEKNSFYESEVARQVNQYGHIAQVFSTYASRKAPGEAPFERGINGFDLANDGTRWWVVTVFWENESQENPIPEKYLKP
ncbi:MAG TPA: hypothetical protein VE825_15940 [Terriglobales bacterium]|jgi:hypothetical protein|nr:hypothetical protein [Terriglobales bacterium]